MKATTLPKVFRHFWKSVNQHGGGIDKAQCAAGWLCDYIGLALTWQRGIYCCRVTSLLIALITARIGARVIDVSIPTP